MGCRQISHNTFIYYCFVLPYELLLLFIWAAFAGVYFFQANLFVMIWTAARIRRRCLLVRILVIGFHFLTNISSGSRYVKRSTHVPLAFGGEEQALKRQTPIKSFNFVQSTTRQKQHIDRRTKTTKSGSVLFEPIYFGVFRMAQKRSECSQDMIWNVNTNDIQVCEPNAKLRRQNRLLFSEGDNASRR